jgi:hypothetical protein
MVTIDTVLVNASYYLSDVASWRAKKAEQYPDDARNRRSAAALEGAATYVDSLRYRVDRDTEPEDLPDGLQLMYKNIEETRHLGWLDEAQAVAARFFFDRNDDIPTTADYERLLFDIAQACQPEEAAELFADIVPPPSNVHTSRPTHLEGQEAVGSEDDEDTEDQTESMDLQILGVLEEIRDLLDQRLPR